MKTTSGVDSPYEVLVVATITTDDEGNLKIKQVDEFGDSQIYLERMKAFSVYLALYNQSVLVVNVKFKLQS